MCLHLAIEGVYSRLTGQKSVRPEGQEEACRSRIGGIPLPVPLQALNFLTRRRSVILCR